MGRVSGGPFPSFINIDGAISAVGTAPEPIVFTSIVDDAHGNPSDTNNDGSATSPARFDWQSITFTDVTTDSLNILEHCIIQYAGWSGWGVTTISASPTFRNCTFNDNWYYGIYMQGTSSPKIENCVFEKHQLTPVVMSLLSNPSFTGNQFLASNAYNAIGIVGETLAQDVLWKRRNVAQIENIPYILVSDLTVGLSAILRIQPGVVIKPWSASIDIFVKRGLIAEGKADPESLIVFTSPADDFYGGDTNNDGNATNPAALRWGRLEIQNEAIDDSTRFNYCVFRYGTTNATQAALNVVSANPQISNSIFQYNGNGINYSGAAGDSTKGKVVNSDFMDNSVNGIKNTGMSFTVSAKSCWWGHPTGPLDASDDTGSGGFYNPGGMGDPVTDGVDYSGFKTNGVQNLALGDVSLNGEVRAFDASLVLQHLAVLITLNAQQITIGDVTCNAGLSSLDASLIQQYVAGLISFFPCATDSIPTLRFDLNDYFKGLQAGDFSVNVPAFEVDPGLEVEVPIELSGTGDVLGHEYRIVFDATQVSIEDVRLTDAANGAMFAWNVDDGELRIALASASVLPVAGAVDVVLRGSDTLDPGSTVAFDIEFARINEQDVTANATSAGGSSGGDRLPTAYYLDQNHPNPFNPTTSINYHIPASAGGAVHVSLVIYDVAGRQVRQLIDRSDAPGIYSELWDGRNDAGQTVGSGVYFYRLEAGSFASVKKMLLLK
jgi:parallel beta-helix repeat protein